MQEVKKVQNQAIMACNDMHFWWCICISVQLSSFLCLIEKKPLYVLTVCGVYLHFQRNEGKKCFFSDNIPVGPWGNGEKAAGSWKQRDEMMLLSQILNRSHQTWFKRRIRKGLQKASLSFKVQYSKCSDAEQQKRWYFSLFLQRSNIISLLI